MSRLKPDHREAALWAALNDHAVELLRPCAGCFFRYQKAKRPSPEGFLDGEGAFKVGGRWNVPGLHRVVYCGNSRTIVMAESEAKRTKYQFPEMAALLVVPIQFSLAKVLDLTDPETLEKLRLDVGHLRALDWEQFNLAGEECLTQCIGRLVHELGAEGLKVPSAVFDDGFNFVYFPSNRRAESQVEVMDQETLRTLEGKGRD